MDVIVEKSKKIILLVVKYKFIFTALIFAVWILFIDSTNIFYISKLKKEQQELQKEKVFLNTEIKKNKSSVEGFENLDILEKYAREVYFMRKPNEDVFVFKDVSENDN